MSLLEDHRHRDWERVTAKPRRLDVSPSSFYEPVHEDPLESRLVTAVIGIFVAAVIYGLVMLW